MKNFLIMTMLQSQGYLSEPVQDLVLVEKECFASLVFLFFTLLLYQGLQISAIAIFHYDTQPAFFSFVDLNELGNVRVIEHFQNLSFLQTEFFFLRLHSVNVYLLNNTLLAD
jgi:hypothetical protein